MKKISTHTHWSPPNPKEIWVKPRKGKKMIDQSLTILPAVGRLEHRFQLAVFEGRIFASAKNAPVIFLDEAGRLPAKVVSIYGTSVNNLHHWQTKNPSWKVHQFCLILSQKRTTHFQAILFGTHLMHPPWLQPLHFLPFVVMWFCVIPTHLTSTTTKSIRDSKVLRVHWLRLAIGDLISFWFHQQQHFFGVNPNPVTVGSKSLGFGIT